MVTELLTGDENQQWNTSASAENSCFKSLDTSSLEEVRAHLL